MSPNRLEFTEVLSFEVLFEKMGTMLQTADCLWPAESYCLRNGLLRFSSLCAATVQNLIIDLPFCNITDLLAILRSLTNLRTLELSVKTGLRTQDNAINPAGDDEDLLKLPYLSMLISSANLLYPILDSCITAPCLERVGIMGVEDDTKNDWSPLASRLSLQDKIISVAFSGAASRQYAMEQFVPLIRELSSVLTVELEGRNLSPLIEYLNTNQQTGQRIQNIICRGTDISEDTLRSFTLNRRTSGDNPSQPNAPLKISAITLDSCTGVSQSFCEELEGLVDRLIVLAPCPPLTAATEPPSSRQGHFENEIEYRIRTKCTVRSEIVVPKPNTQMLQANGVSEAEGDSGLATPQGRQSLLDNHAFFRNQTSKIRELVSSNAKEIDALTLWIKNNENSLNLSNRAENDIKLMTLGLIAIHSLRSEQLNRYIAAHRALTVTMTAPEVSLASLPLRLGALTLEDNESNGALKLDALQDRVQETVGELDRRHQWLLALRQRLQTKNYVSSQEIHHIDGLQKLKWNVDCFWKADTITFIHNLTLYVMWDHWPGLQRALQGLINLRYLKLVGIEEEAMDVMDVKTMDPVLLPKLTHFVGTFGLHPTLLQDCIRVPSLHHIGVCGTYAYDSESRVVVTWSSLVDHLKTRNMITSLGFSESISTKQTLSQFVPILQQFSTVEAIELEGRFMLPVIDYLKENRNFAPMLCSLVLRGTDVGGDLIQSLVESRSKPVMTSTNRVSISACGIKSVTFDHCTGITRASCEELRELIEELNIYC
ncbi:hypothetical protein FRC17_009475 [Serendipita sp. 399]|nr:hypothetical protein FRC17_009475 [Serendipita sp. 399]